MSSLHSPPALKYTSYQPATETEVIFSLISGAAFLLGGIDMPKGSKVGEHHSMENRE